jgi:acyl carrier protein
MDRIDALRLGLPGTIDALRQILVDNFAIARAAGEIGSDEPLFAGGLDLSSLQGLSLIILVEKRFGVRINELDTSIQDIATLSRLARHLLKLSEQGRQPMTNGQ